MRRMKCVGLAAMFFALLGAAYALAAGKAVAPGKVSFTSGGVGVESQERLKAREKEFNLKLVFTLVEGNYLADVSVRIADAAGKTVMEQVSDGPFFMAKLPAGAYSVTAAYNGQTQTRKVVLRADRLHTEYMRWASNPERDFVLAPEGREAPGARVVSPRETTRAGAPGGVSYLSGGIGENAQAELTAREKEFNLKLVFTLVEGNYLADVGVRITDAGGKTVIEQIAGGPFFLAKLPAGTYTLTASYNDKTQTRKVKVGSGLRTEYLRWPSNPQTDFPVPHELARGK